MYFFSKTRSKFHLFETLIPVDIIPGFFVTEMFPRNIIQAPIHTLIKACQKRFFQKHKENIVKYKIIAQFNLQFKKIFSFYFWNRCLRWTLPNISIPSLTGVWHSRSLVTKVFICSHLVSKCFSLSREAVSSDSWAVAANICCLRCLISTWNTHTNLNNLQSLSSSINNDAFPFQWMVFRSLTMQKRIKNCNWHLSISLTPRDTQM